MYCSACGKLNPDGAQFCPACGQPTAAAIVRQGLQSQPPIARAQRMPIPQSYESIPSNAGIESIAHSQPWQGPQYSQPSSVHVTQQVQVAPIVLYQPKSVGLALALTFFFGPLGLFYSSVIGGVVMLILSVILAATTFGVSLFFTWPACMIWGAIAASNYNSAMALAARGPTQINKY
jgi:hypothetical protein